METLYIIAFVAFIVIALYLLAIMPRLVRRPAYDGLKGYAYAHRGFYNNNSGIPENSMKAFEAAVSKGYGIELDVQLSKDNIPVVFHDESLKRVCGVSGNVKDYTYDELQKFRLCNTKERIPSFSSVLDLVGGRVPLIVEIKCEDGKTQVCRYAYELLEHYTGVYCIESFHPFAVKWFRKKQPSLVRGQLSTYFYMSGDNRFIMWFMGHLLFNFIGRPDFIAYDALYVNELSRRICRSLYGCLCVAWTIKSQKQLDGVKDYYDLFIFEGFEPKL